MKRTMRELRPELRQIGFGIWDPLGLAEAWADGEPMADEYDSYLQGALAKAMKGGGTGAVCEALREAEVRMGLVDGGPADRRAQAAIEILESTSRRSVG